MYVKELFGKVVLDKNANEIGKIEDMSINTEDFTVESIKISLKKNFRTSEEISIECEDIATIGQYIILNKEIDDENIETVKVKIID